MDSDDKNIILYHASTLFRGQRRTNFTIAKLNFLFKKLLSKYWKTHILVIL
jgi:hypothetical protein